MLIYLSEDEFLCACGGKVAVPADGTPVFCDSCKTLYCVDDGKLEIRTPQAVIPESKGTC